MKSSVNKEHGGTIIGLIIGLVIGLGIAVVVAVTITKASTPFTNKLGMTKAVDTPPIQLTDPNRPLYGDAYNEAPANRPIAEKSLTNVDSGEDTTAANESSENAVTYPDVENTPNSMKPVAKTETTAATKKTTDEKASYYLQVGAFRAASDAENVRAKLALIDVESGVSEKNSEGDNLYRVRIGPFNSIDSMNRMRAKLAENSIDVAVIKTPN